MSSSHDLESHEKNTIFFIKLVSSDYNTSIL